MLNNEGGPYVGVVIDYPESEQEDSRRSEIIEDEEKALHTDTLESYAPCDSISLGVIGAGLFGKALLLPSLKKIKHIKLSTLATSSSSNVYHTAIKYGFNQSTTDYKELLDDNDINSVIILTPHSMHANMVIEALHAGKHVFVEKPLCINEEELKEVMDKKASFSDRFLMVGYNRRFSPHASRARDEIKKRKEPVVIHYRINAGFVAHDHWVHSEEEGGSRIVGEVCHFVDMLQYLTGSNPVRVYAERVSGDNRAIVNSDNLAVTVKFQDGSIGSIVYAGSGDKSFSREQIEIFSEGKTVIIRDFKETQFYYSGKKKSFKTINQEMGYKEELQHFFDIISGKLSPGITPGEMFYSTQAVFSIVTSLSTGRPASIF
jgi:predicted dehydrogenase